LKVNYCYTLGWMSETARQPSFDVRRWLTEVTGRDGWRLAQTMTRHGGDFVASYTAQEAVAVVALHTLPVKGTPSWELLADFAGWRETIVIPVRTHLDW
jgi:hypothetical protein